MKIGIFVLILILTICLLLFLPIRVTIQFIRDGDGRRVYAVLEIFKIKINLSDKKKKEKKSEKKSSKKDPSFEKESAAFKKYISIFECTKADIGKLLRRIGERALVFENVRVHLKFGFSNAMHTGIFTGTANGLVYGVLGIIHHNSRLEKMDVNILPVFDETCFCADFACILRTKPVHIINIAIGVLKILRKIRKIERRG